MAFRWLARLAALPGPRPGSLISGVLGIALTATGGAATPPPLAWQSESGYRTAVLNPSPPPDASAPNRRFTELPAESLGIRWTNQISATRYATRQNTMNGAGLALADFDGDGWCDVFLCGKEGPSGLFRNLSGWQFEEVTDLAGVACAGMIATGAAVGDVDGDGRPDLHVTSFLGPDALFLNLGGMRFTNVTTAAGLKTSGGNTSSAFSDVDGDGDLDLYLCRFGVESILRDGARITTRMVAGVPVPTGRFARRLKVVNGQLVEFGESDLLFLNQGRGTFRPAVWPDHFVDAQGVPLPEGPLDFSLAVQIRDFNGDGHPDLYICSDFQTPDRFWLGVGAGQFRAAPAGAIRTISLASMGVDAADLDRDGKLDFITVEMLSLDPRRTLAQAPQATLPSSVSLLEPAEVARNVLQWNRGNGTYAEIAWYAGVAASDWSWTPIFVDVDLDGFQDLLVSNGHPHDLNDLDVATAAMAARKPGADPAMEHAPSLLVRYPALTPPKVAWRNSRNLQFEDRSDTWGFHSRRIVHGMALADLDNDGDLDVVGNTWRDTPLFYRNDSAEPRVAVRLVPRPPHDAAGTKVRLLGGPVPSQELEVLAGGRYLSSDQPQLTFAPPALAGTPSTLVVHWRHGGTTTVRPVLANRLYEIREPESPGSGGDPTPGARPPKPWFAAGPTHRIDGVHHSAPAKAASQSLLPWRLDRPGPAVASITGSAGTWLLLSTGGDDQGARAPAIRFEPSGSPGGVLRVEPVPRPAAGTPELAEVALASLHGDEPSALATVAAPTPESLSLSPSVLLWHRTNGQWSAGEPLRGLGAAAGPLAIGDLDGDGDPDLAVGGRWIPGRYPEPAPVAIFTNHLGRLLRDDARSEALARVGLVTGLAIADLDRDGTNELVASCEWGSLRVFRLDRGRATPDPASASLAEVTGLWQCLAVADFDGDGRLDIAAGNWGLNTAWQRSPGGRCSLAHGEFAAPGQVGLIECWSSTGDSPLRPRRRRDVLRADLPWLPGAFPSHRAYADATLPNLLEGHPSPSGVLTARTLTSAVFLNRTDGWQQRELPPQAQWTPIHRLLAVDLDRNGPVDMVCAQNHASMRADDERVDAGIGLVLINDGTARFRSLNPDESGIVLWGEQRGLAAADLNRDGRPDLVTAETDGPVRIWWRTDAEGGDGRARVR